MRIKSNVKAGGSDINHNQAVKGLRVKSSIRAGKLATNHNQTLAAIVPARNRAHIERSEETEHTRGRASSPPLGTLSSVAVAAITLLRDRCLGTHEASFFAVQLLHGCSICS